MRWRHLIIGLLVFGAAVTTASAQLPSVLVTPRVELDVTQQNVQPQVQVQPQYAQTQPQVICIQPQQPVQTQPAETQFDRYMRLRMFQHMMFNATYEQRGILFPRYVRRPNAGFNQMMILRMYSQ